MKITEKPIKKSVYKELRRFSKATQIELGFEAQQHDAKASVEWVDSLVYQWQHGKRPPEKIVSLEDLPLLLGFSWGEQMIAAYGWEWVNLIFHEHDDWEAMAIVSKDRSLMILPFAFIHECINDHADITISASFNFINSDIIPEFAPKSYTNVMEGLHRIVPRI